MSPAQPDDRGTTGNDAVERAPVAADPFIRCGATTKAGNPCSNGAGPDGYCIAHSKSPQTLATVQAARSLGGKAPRVRVGLTPAVVEAVDLGSSEGQVDVLNATLKALAIGSISSTTATAIATLVKTANQVLDGVRDEQIRELAAQLDQLVQESPRARR